MYIAAFSKEYWVPILVIELVFVADFVLLIAVHQKEYLHQSFVIDLLMLVPFQIF